MATYATAADFKTKYQRYENYGATVLDEYLDEAESEIAGTAGDYLATIAADANGLIALKHVTMGLAHEALTKRPVVGVRSGSRQEEHGEDEGERARRLLDRWIKWAGGRTGSLHTEKLTDSPTFDMNDPETWDIDPAD